MKVRAPGKLVLTGAYAVLDGAPAVVLAVDRHAVADGSCASKAPPPEVAVAFAGGDAPVIDVSALQDPSGRKLGLGSSAAAVVAALGTRAHARGEDLAQSGVRERILRAAREAHARVQSGGSGADVAASVYGGAIRYELRGDDASIQPVRWPRGLVLAPFFSGSSARTSDLRARVDAARARRAEEGRDLARAMARAAVEAAEAFERGQASEVAHRAAAYGALLAQLGDFADAPIVPKGWDTLARRAVEEDAAFLPSGAGGGDVAVWLGGAPPSASFMALARELGLQELPLSVDPDGVRAVSHDHE